MGSNHPSDAAIIEHLLDWVDAGMPGSENSAVAEHLDKCSECSGRSSRLARLLNASRGAGLDGPVFPEAAADGDCPDEQAMARFFLHEMGGKERRAFVSHLEQCDLCRHLVASAVQESTVEPERSPAEAGLERTLEGAAIAPWRRLFGTPRRFAFSGGFAGALVAATLAVFIMTRPAGLPFEVVRQPDLVVRDGRAQGVEEGEILRSGERISIRFFNPEEADIYLLHLQSGSGPTILFPNPSITLANPLAGSRSYEIPPGGYWRLDDRTGLEALFLITSGKDRPDPAELLNAVRTAMGPDGGEEETLRNVQALLEDRFARVSTFRYYHR